MESKQQLHAGVNVLMAFMLRMTAVMAFSSVPVVLMVGQETEFLIRVVIGIEQLALGVVLTLFLRSYPARVFATDVGIELDSPKKVVPWSEIQKLVDLGIWTGVLSHRHQLHFRTKRSPITFYADPDAVGIVNRYLLRFAQDSPGNG